MKKILSLTLAVLMVVSMIPTAFAADVDYQNGTEVEYTGTRSTVEDDGSVTHNAEYTITVPALLAPGGSGTVTLQGMWPSDATVKVTAEDKVEMVNNINSADKKTLAVTFTAIELAGNNTAAVSDDETVSVADISNALFGTWAGKFNYNVEYNGEAGGSGTVTPTPDPDTGDDSEVTIGEGTATFSDGVTLSWADLRVADNGTKYDYNANKVTETGLGTYAFQECETLTSINIPAGASAIGMRTFQECTNLQSVTIPNSVTRIDDNAFLRCTSLTEINYSGTQQQWSTIDFDEIWNSGCGEITVNCTDGTVIVPAYSA